MVSAPAMSIMACAMMGSTISPRPYMAATIPTVPSTASSAIWSASNASSSFSATRKCAISSVSPVSKNVYEPSDAAGTVLPSASVA